MIAMSNLEDNIYKPLKTWVKDARNHQQSWDVIKNRIDDDDFFKNNIFNNFWPEDSQEIWIDIVRGVEIAENDTKKIKEIIKRGTLRGPNQKNELPAPDDEDSCWQLYSNLLIKKGFNNIDVIREECVNILHNISMDTKGIDPVKGLVVGNVQSGKTANMAGLISMAADYGWNFFIILSGTIDNLRRQTRDRLYSDLNNSDGKLIWKTFDHLNLKVADAKPSQLSLESSSAVRYLSVCLKNKKRLTDLLKWINDDPGKKSQMKVLLIDDEADQASINTADPGEERKKINGLIVKLVNGENESGEKIPYGAMNYIAYTATPYANFLSEGTADSLYPRDFVSLLTPSSLYLGPAELFGHEDLNLSGLDIINTYEKCDDKMRDIYNHRSDEIPEGLKDSLCWFICSVAVLRYQKYVGSVSMLVHTTALTDYHERVAKFIMSYLTSNRNSVMNRCKLVYEAQTSKLSMDDFLEQVPNYGNPNPPEINDYPNFSEIEDIVKSLITMEPGHIKLDDEGDIAYREGLHICIDNAKKMTIDDEEDSLPRLLYPERKSLGSNKCPSKVPAFIIVGGNTMSRGLTIEGLVSTYFARISTQADTLMQMGRWFGYRRGYELMPRLWMSTGESNAFETLTDLDYSLRQFIRENYSVFTPEDFPPLVKQFPKSNYLKSVTSKTKMKGAVETDYVFEGTMVETTSFDKNVEDLKHNIEITEKFIKSLGKSSEANYPFKKICPVWFGVPGDKIFNDFLEQFRFSSKQRNFKTLNALKDWIHKNSRNTCWDVAIGNINEGKHGTWDVCDKTVYVVERAAKEDTLDKDDVVYVGSSLSSPDDRLADLDLSTIRSDVDLFEKYDSLKSGISTNWREIRALGGLSETPMLLIYRISKDSEPRTDGKYKLYVDEDLIGISIIMPGLSKEKVRALYYQLPPTNVRRPE